MPAEGSCALDGSEWGCGGCAPAKRGAGRSPASIEGGWAGESRAQRVLVRDGGDESEGRLSAALVWLRTGRYELRA